MPLLSESRKGGRGRLRRLATHHDGLWPDHRPLVAAWLGQNPLEQLLGAARLDHLLHLVVVDLGERESLGKADRVQERGELIEAPLDDLTLVGCEVFHGLRGITMRAAYGAATANAAISL